MSKPQIRSVVFVSAAVAVAGAIAWRFAGWDAGFILFMFCAAVCIAYGRMLRDDGLREMQNIKLGSENLPSIKDVASVLVRGQPISDDKKKALLNALSRARRAALTGTVAKEIPFQIVDRWGGSWQLTAYVETGGTRGFSINRVCYSGADAAVVAESVGMHRERDASWLR
jgi:hypothetical protein